MAYLALYRRFRPQGFEGLIGQEHIVKILKNQIRTGKVGHAYLFCGARGTGKTTVAKVFARAINCLSPVDGSPCGECEVCRGLKDPSNIDILEMDAASNNGVDDVREMRDKIQYPPVVGKYKVYIVDEVHMLSPAAFNALLKTLEEPPAHAVFIFATTEVHKIPQTILSRCMRFDFKLIALPELVSLIKRIFDEIGKEYEEEAIDAIARAGEGSARDSLSIADMCSSYSEGKLKYKDVLEVLGATDKGKVLELTESIINGDTGVALDTINTLAMLGKNMGVLANDVACVLRDLMICSTAKNANAILSLPQARFVEYDRVASACDGHRLLRLIDIFTSLDNAFRYTTHPRIVLETAVVRACRPDEDYNTDALLARMAQVERAVKEGARVYVEKQPTANAEVNNDVNPPSNATKQEISANREAEDVVRKVEENKAKPIEVVEEKPVKVERVAEDEFGFAPDFDEASGGFFFGVDMPKKEEKSAISHKNEENSTASEQRESVPPVKLWGNVLRTLRSNGHAVLWTVCKDVTAKATEGLLTIIVSSDSEYDMFNRADHFKTLSTIAEQLGGYKLKISKKYTPDDGSDEFERDVEELKQTFGNEVVKVIKE